LTGENFSPGFGQGFFVEGVGHKFAPHRR